MKIRTSGPIVSRQIDGGQVETVTDFIFLGSKTTAGDDHSHEIEKCLLLTRKAMTNLDSILKSRGIILPRKVHVAKAVVFPGVICRCKIWTIGRLSSKELMLSNCGAGEDS